MSQLGFLMDSMSSYWIFFLHFGFYTASAPQKFKKNPFFLPNKRISCKYNSNAKPNPGQHHSSFHLLAHSNAGLVFLFQYSPRITLRTEQRQYLQYWTLMVMQPSKYPEDKPMIRCSQGTARCQSTSLLVAACRTMIWPVFI